MEANLPSIGEGDTSLLKAGFGSSRLAVAAGELKCSATLQPRHIGLL